MSPKPGPTKPSSSRMGAWLSAVRRRRGGQILPFSLKSASSKLMALLLVALAVFVSTFFLAIAYLSPASGGDGIPFSELRGLTQQRQVLTATLHDFDHRITGTYRENGRLRQFHSSYPSSDAETPFLIDSLVDNGARVDVEAQTDKGVVQFVATYLLPLVILANLFGLIFVGTRAGGGDSLSGLADFSTVGKGRGATGGGVTTFADVAGADEAIVELAEVKDYLENPERFAALGAQAPKGVMMLGPPGCGKTLMARALAGEAGVPFFSISGAEFVESLVGVGAARVRDLFRQVRRVAPAIVFIDEIDAAGRRRGGVTGGQEEREQTLNQLLIEMDGFDPSAGIVVVGATNRPDILDPALLRPGRFDRQVTVEPPDIDGRIAILRLYAERRPLAEGIDFDYLARRTSGFTGAELAGVVNEAALLSLRQNKPDLSMPEFEEAVQRVGGGPQRRGHALTPEERGRAAHHEAAHVLVGAVTGRLGDIPRVSIVAHGRTLGSTTGRAWAERTLLTRSELLDEMVTLLAGGVCERMAFGDPSTGSDADLEQATSLAQLMVGRYGMNDKLGLVRLLRVEGSEFLTDEMVPHQMVGESVLAELHQEVRLLLDEAAATAESLIDGHRDVLGTLVTRLLDHESLEGAELESIVGHLRPVRADAELGYGLATVGNSGGGRRRTARTR